MNLHNSWIPRDFWLEDWEREAVIRFFLEHTTDGYRRAAFMMLGANVVAVSPANAGAARPARLWSASPSRIKGKKELGEFVLHIWKTHRAATSRPSYRESFSRVVQSVLTIGQAMTGCPRLASDMPCCILKN